MKIFIATDGSTHSKAMLEKVADKLFPPKTKVHIVPAYERTPLITAVQPMVCLKSIMLKPTNMR